MLIRSCEERCDVPPTFTPSTQPRRAFARAGPAIGDIRSRLVRLVDGKGGATSGGEVIALLNRRLNNHDRGIALSEFMSIMDGTSEHWEGMCSHRTHAHAHTKSNICALEIHRRSSANAHVPTRAI